MRIAILGTNAWAVTVAVPLLLARPDGSTKYLLGALCIVPLGLGIALLPSYRRTATWLLLALYPAALASVTAVAPGEGLQRDDGPVGLVLAAVSLIAYGAGTVWTVSRPEQLRPTTAKALEPAATAGELHRRRAWMRNALLLATSTGALAVAIVAPTLGAARELEQTWGAAAAEASVLTALAGAVLGTAMMALIVAPATRLPRRTPPSDRQVALRVALLLFGALAGAFTLHVAGSM